MATPAAIVFDLDDTLYPERDYVFSGYVAVATAFKDQFGDPAATAAAMRRLFDTAHRRLVFDAFLQDRAVRADRKLVDRMIEVYRQHCPSIQLHGDASEALQRLRPRCRLGLLTDGPSVSQWAKINALDLVGQFDSIIVTSDLGPDFTKPHPRGFEQMAVRLGSPASALIYVADNPAKDFVAPNALGWRTIRIFRADGIYRDTAAAAGGEPQSTIQSLDLLG